MLPDLDACKDGGRRWVEVKTKSTATFTRMTQRLEHGIDRRHYNEYLSVQRITGTPVFIVVYEENTGEILWSSVDDLEPYKRFSDKMGRGGMVFWPRERFKKLCKVAPKRKSEDAA